MTKRTTLKRLSSTSQLASNSIDIKARQRIEQLYELTDEIINAYNEINEKYVHQIYRKYKQLQEINKKLKKSLNHHHCAGCKCGIKSNGDNEEEEAEDESSEEDDEQRKNSALPSSTTSSVITRTEKRNPFIISDIEETQNFNGNDSRFNKNSSDDEADKTSMDTDQTTRQTKTRTESSEENDDEEAEEDNGMASLPLTLRNVIRKKAKRNKNAKLYLLEIPRYPALCEYLRDKSRKSFDYRPSDDQVRPLIDNHIGKQQANDSKIRMRLRDELREIHRSYMRTFMSDPRTMGSRSMVQKAKLPVKKSPV